jgi:hypothetical protein
MVLRRSVFSTIVSEVIRSISFCMLSVILVCPILLKVGLQDSVTYNLYAPILATPWIFIQWSQI